MATLDFVSNSTEEEYDNFIAAHPHGTLFYSTKYKHLLTGILSNVQPQYMVLREEGKIVGVLPAFLKEGRLGSVLNSLPFFGSHGGVLTSQFVNNTDSIKRRMIKDFNQLARDKDCFSSVIITPLLEQDISPYEQETRYDFCETRIGQVTHLPAEGPDFEDQLFRMFDSGERGAARKGGKAGIKFSYSGQEEDLKMLRQFHVKNAATKGFGQKPLEFFSQIPKIFEFDKEYRVYFAEKDGKFIAGLLLFYFNRTVEYFVPAMDDEFRTLRPLGVLIVEAMKDAVRRGYKYWNWGGTQEGQDGVYNFKRKWGAKDHPYKYYVSKHKACDSLVALGREGLTEQFPYFYVVPFSSLIQA
jgi:CelD/BcsL family acetyltransferase involved in cellulose biosynthesis